MAILYTYTKGQLEADRLVPPSMIVVTSIRLTVKASIHSSRECSRVSVQGEL